MENFQFVFDYVLNTFGVEHIFTVFFIMNFILATIAYELGFAKKLSIIKKIFTYVLLVIGIYILTIFSTVMRMPTVESLIVIDIVLIIYRTRLHFQRKAKKQNNI